MCVPPELRLPPTPTFPVPLEVLDMRPTTGNLPPNR